MIDQRQGPRVALADPIAVADAESGIHLGLLINLSREGFMLITDEAFRPGTEFRLRAPLASDGSGVEIEARCLWCQRSSYSEQYGAGFALIRPSDAVDRALNRLLAR